MPDVLAIDTWASNADLISDCFTLGYLRQEWLTLDPTWGHGTFWQRCDEPDRFVASDIELAKAPTAQADFTNLPFKDQVFDAVVFDPPYKLNGTPDEMTDRRYGVHTRTSWQDRMVDIMLGIRECCRVCNDVGYLLVKVQDQVCSGKVRWQSHFAIQHGMANGFGLVDRFDFVSHRPQPSGRRQVHARRNSSQLLVFKRGYYS